MISLLISVLFSYEDFSVKFEDTDVFQPLTKTEVVVTDSGHVYVLNTDERKIIHYGINGKKVGDIARKGQGPGEFTFPTHMFLRNENLYVLDLGNDTVNRFDLDGKYLGRASLPGHGLYVVKPMKGWLYANWRFAPDPSTPASVFWANDDLKESKELIQWPRTAAGGMMMMQAGSGGLPKVPHNPVPDRPFMVSGPEGKWVIVSQPGLLKLRVIDIEHGTVARVITRDEKPVLFNEDWGNKKVKEFKENMSRRGMKLTVEPDFPEHFPLVRGLAVSQDGKIVIEKWSMEPDKVKHYLVLDRKGQDASLNYLPSHEARIMAIYGDKAYISLFNKDDQEATIAVCPTNAINRVAKEHPIDYEGSGARMMVQTH